MDRGALRLRPASLTLPLSTERHVAAALAALQAWDAWWLAEHDVPGLYDLGAAGLVRYVQEPRGQERWLTVPQVIMAGGGDCEDLAAWRAAEVPGAMAVPFRTDGGMHVVVQMPDGTVEDPSIVLGMEV